MSRQFVQNFVDSLGGRLLGDGLHWADLKEVLERCESWDGWYHAMAEIGDRYERLAEQSLAAGHTISAGELFWLACMYYHFAQSHFFHRPELREAGQHKKVELYRRGAALFSPAAERVEIAFEEFTIPAYLRLPAGSSQSPCVVLIGGVESTKEESYLFEHLCLRRGLATFAFDGPGQGEMYFQTKMRSDFERFTTAVVDYLETRSEINTNRLGVLGRSLGGHYAVKSAGYDERFQSCVDWNGPYSVQAAWDGLPPLLQQGYRYCAGQPTVEAAKDYLKIIDLNGWPERVRCPLYLMHGAKDTVIPVSQTERVHREARNAKQLVMHIEPDARHCGHEVYQRVRYQLADFLADTLGA